MLFLKWEKFLLKHVIFLRCFKILSDKRFQVLLYNHQIIYLFCTAIKFWDQIKVENIDNHRLSAAECGKNFNACSSKWYCGEIIDFQNALLTHLYFHKILHLEVWWEIKQIYWV